MTINNKLFLVILLIAIPLLVDARRTRGTTSNSGSNTACPVTISATNIDSGRLYNTYRATLLNPSAAKVSNIAFKTGSDLRTIDDVERSRSGFKLEDDSSLEPQSSYSFIYSANKITNVRWAISCTSSAPAAPVNPTSAPAPVDPTNPSKAPVKPTTAAPAKPTTAPVKPTIKPTTKPTTPAAIPSTTGKKCPAGTWWRPRPTTTWQWQLTGTIDTSLNVQMYDIDLFDNSKAVIDTLHSQGKAVICYFSTQYEDWRPDASSWTSAVLGNPLDNWAGERYNDIRSTLVRNLMAARLDLAVSKGCDGVEPDNVDGYQASTGFPITAADQLDFNQFIATQAHARGLSVGLKNDGDQAKALEPSFDWALNEQCFQYKECSALNVFTANNKAVFNCEYSGSASNVCPTQNNLKFSTLIKKLDLGAAITAQCCTSASAGCAPAAYDCVSS